MWAALRAVALPLQGAAGPSPRVWGALLVGAWVSFPKSSAALAVNQAWLSKEQRSWRSWSQGGEAAEAGRPRPSERAGPPAGWRPLLATT